MTTAEYRLMHRLGELAAHLLADPESYDRRRRLAAAVESYDAWRAFAGTEMAEWGELDPDVLVLLYLPADVTPPPGGPAPDAGDQWLGDDSALY